METVDGEGESPCGCKVTRVATDHDLNAIHADLERQWTGEPDASVRDLADQFNRRILRAALVDAGRTPIRGEVENIYGILQGEDTDAASRTETRERLRREGLPLDDLEDGFVSHQTMYRHLTDCLDLEKDPPIEDEEDLVETWRDRLLALEARTARVTERGIEQLQAGGALDVGSAEVLVDVNVICNDCGAFYTVEQLLDRRTCECGAELDGTTG